MKGQLKLPESFLDNKNIFDNDTDKEDDDGLFDGFREKSYSASESKSTILTENQIFQNNRLWRSFKSKFKDKSSEISRSNHQQLALYPFPNDLKTSAHSFFTPSDDFDPNVGIGTRVDRKTVVILVTGTTVAIVDFINALINYAHGKTNDNQVRLVSSEIFNSNVTTFEINWRSSFVIPVNLFLIAVSQTERPENFLAFKNPDRWYASLLGYLKVHFPKGIKISALCSVLSNCDKINFTNAAKVAEKVMNMHKLTVLSDKWFIFLNEDLAEMPVSLCDPKLEQLTNFMLANAQLIKLPKDQKSTSDFFANDFGALETYHFNFQHLKSEGNLSIITRRLFILCARLSEIFKSSKTSAKGSLFGRILKKKETFSQDQLAAAYEVETEILGEVWKIHCEKYEFAAITDTIAAIIIITERCCNNFHLIVLNFFKSAYEESKKLQSLDIKSSGSDSKLGYQSWVGEMRRRLCALKEARNRQTTRESVTSEENSEHTESTSSW